MKLVDFWEGKPTPVEINMYYFKTQELIENRFDPDKNPNYKQEFGPFKETEIDKLRQDQMNELSTEAAFVLLAYIESLFRTDFVRRIENRKWRDNLSQFFREERDPSKKLYQFGLDKIFEGWKKHYGYVNKKMIDILNILPQYYDYRNWVAHGRYWRFKESNYERKYNYVAIRMLLNQINTEFGGKFKL